MVEKFLFIRLRLSLFELKLSQLTKFHCCLFILKEHLIVCFSAAKNEQFFFQTNSLKWSNEMVQLLSDVKGNFLIKRRNEIRWKLFLEAE